MNQSPDRRGERRTAPVAARPPALSQEEFLRLGHKSIELAADYLYALPGQPVFRPMSPAQRKRLLTQEWSAAGVDPVGLLDEIGASILPFAEGNGHPRFFGWINSPPAPVGMFGEFFGAVQGSACDVGDIAALYLEPAVIGWLADLMGWSDDSATGLLTSGGSVATLTCLAVARQWRAERDGWDVRQDGLAGAGDRRYVIYVSSQAHSSVTKAVELLGFGSSSIHQVGLLADFRMDPVQLARTVDADRRSGLVPFAVVASAGTTNTGAVDPLAEIAGICADQDLWLHVDGAYGAIGVIHPRLADVYAGLERADSITLDPHKWLSVPIECGCALVRHPELMRRSFSLIPPYLHTQEGVGVGGPPSYAEYGIQQTRGFRSLKLWMTLQHMGRDGLRELVIRHVALARYLSGLIGEAPDLTPMAPVTLSVVCFRYEPPGSWPDDYLDRLNRELEVKVQDDGRVFLTATWLDHRFVLRACVLHYDTTEEDIRYLVDVVRELGQAVHAQLQRDLARQ